MARRDLSWNEAILEVLTRSEGALHYNEIAERVDALGLRRAVGPNPKNSVAAILSKSLSDGDSLFQKVSPGVYTLKTRLAGSPSSLEETQAQDEAREETGALQAFGMFWNRNLVNWAPTQPRLLGRASPAADQVDFAEQVGIYLLHDRDRTVYVGRASDTLVSRLRFHTLDRLNARWDRFSWFGLKSVGEGGRLCEPFLRWDHTDVIETMEAVLIEGLEPPLNRRRGDNLATAEYLQVEDPNNRRKQLIGELLGQ